MAGAPVEYHLSVTFAPKAADMGSFFELSRFYVFYLAEVLEGLFFVLTMIIFPGRVKKMFCVCVFLPLPEGDKVFRLSAWTSRPPPYGGVKRGLAE